MHKILSQILEAKKERIEVLKKNIDALTALQHNVPSPVSFKSAIRRPGKISFIAEIKQASPSAGVLRKDFAHMELARSFAESGVNAISVVTEEDFFLGKVNFIEDIKKEIRLPVLRKDFILDTVQILESRVAGADAVLLIMAALDQEKLKKLYAYAKELGMDVLVEVHTENELKKALSLGADIIGVNNRNLHTFQVSLESSHKLLAFIPDDVVKVSESGINSRKDVLLLKGWRTDAVLVGEAIMKAHDVREKINELHVDP